MWTRVKTFVEFSNKLSTSSPNTVSYPVYSYPEKAEAGNIALKSLFLECVTAFAPLWLVCYYFQEDFLY